MERRVFVNTSLIAGRSNGTTRMSANFVEKGTSPGTGGEFSITLYEADALHQFLDLNPTEAVEVVIRPYRPSLRERLSATLLALANRLDPEEA